MHRSLTSVAALACICMLAMQIGGLHLHVDTKGNDAGIHGAHVHHADPDHHDHSADIDVSLLEQLGINWSKLIPLLFVCAVVIMAAAWIRRPDWYPPLPAGKVLHRLRWRPPLRAPPVSHQSFL